LKCCGREIDVFDRVIDLYDVDNMINRKIRIVNCSVCGALLAELQYYNCKKEFYEYIRPKRKHVAEWIKTFEQEKYLEKALEESEFGTLSDMNWVSGTQTKQSEFAIDFNKVARLVRTTDVEVFEKYRENNLLYHNNDVYGLKTCLKYVENCIIKFLLSCWHLNKFKNPSKNIS